MHVVFYISGVFWVRDKVSVWVFFVLFFVFLMLAVKGVNDIVIGVMEVEGLRKKSGGDVIDAVKVDRKKVVVGRVTKVDLRCVDHQLAIRGACAIFALAVFIYSITVFIGTHNYIAPVLNRYGGDANGVSIHHLEDFYLMLLAFCSISIFVPSAVALIIGFVRKYRMVQILKRGSKG
jgi:hypothetical protein